jgi:hypothetical protein
VRQNPHSRGQGQARTDLISRYYLEKHPYSKDLICASGASGPHRTTVRIFNSRRCRDIYEIQFGRSRSCSVYMDVIKVRLFRGCRRGGYSALSTVPALCLRSPSMACGSYASIGTMNWSIPSGQLLVPDSYCPYSFGGVAAHRITLPSLETPSPGFRRVSRTTLMGCDLIWAR